MFERFTEDARQVIVVAKEEAGLLLHDRIGTEHLLIGLARGTEDLPGRALAEFGVDADKVRTKVIEEFGRGDKPTQGQIPFTQTGKKTLELALRAALKLDHNWIESGHVLLGLIDCGPSSGYEVLQSLVPDVDPLYERVVTLLAENERPLEQIRAHVRESTSKHRVEIHQVASFSATPDARLQRVLMAAAGRALERGQTEFRIEDVLAAISASVEDQDPPPPRAA